MQYLITLPNNKPFLTKWYVYDNHYTEGMIIYDLVNFVYSEDGKTWKEINIDHL